MDFLSYFLIAYLDTLPYLHIQYMALSKKMRFGKKAVYSIATAILVLLALGYAFLATFGHFDKTAMIVYREAQLLIFFALPFFLTGENAFKILFFDALIFPFSTMISSSSSILAKTIGGGVIDFHTLVIVRFIMAAIMLIATYYLWKRFSKDATDIDDKFFWMHIFHLPIILCMIDSFFLPSDFEMRDISLRLYIGSVLICLLGFAIAYVSFILARYETNKMVMQERNQKDKMLIELQEQQYEQLADQIEKSRRDRHDMRHHFIAISRLAEVDDVVSARVYIQNVLREYSEVTPNIKICENFAANAILSHYIEKARDNAIPIKVQFILKDDFHIQDSDLCVLIGNAVENAIEASLEVEENKRFIQIRTSSNAGRLYIVFVNSFKSSPKIKNGEFLSAKREYKRSGVGISSIRAIAKKYNGDIKIETDDNVFKLAVMIPEQE